MKRITKSEDSQKKNVLVNIETSIKEKLSVKRKWYLFDKKELNDWFGMVSRSNFCVRLKSMTDMAEDIDFKMKTRLDVMADAELFDYHSYFRNKRSVALVKDTKKGETRHIFFTKNLC